MPPAGSAGKNLSSFKPISSACSISVGVQAPGRIGIPSAARMCHNLFIETWCDEVTCSGFDSLVRLLECADGSRPDHHFRHLGGDRLYRARGAATTTALLRHGETALSGERRFAGRGHIPLTATGRQAAAAAARLAARGGLDLIVTSPLERTRRTAGAVAAATGVPVVVGDGWMETDFGEWEGLSQAEAERAWPGQMAAWLSDTGAAPPGGESFDATSDRVLKALDSLLAEQAGATVLVVSHVTPMKILLLHALLAPAGGAAAHAAGRRLPVRDRLVCRGAKFVLQLEAQLADRDVTIELSEPAKAWLIEHGYDEQMGARPMARVIQEHIKKPLADEVLFGQLKAGGHVRVVLLKDEADAEDKGKIGFEFVEGPVTPKPEKLPGTRKRSAAPRKPKPGGPGGGGSKGPASRGPLVKV